MTNHNGFHLLGMDVGDSINFIIAIVATLGFILSLVFSVYTIKHSNRLFKKQNDIALAEKRIDIIEYFFRLFGNDWKSKPDLTELNLYYFRTKYYFENCKGFIKDCDALLNYYDGKPLPDYIHYYNNKHDEIKTNEDAFFYHILCNLRCLKDEIGVSKNK